MKKSIRIGIAAILVACTFTLLLSNQIAKVETWGHTEETRNVIQGAELETMGMQVKATKTTNKEQTLKTNEQDKKRKEAKETEKKTKVTDAVTKEIKRELSLVAVGDNLIHTQIIRSGLQQDGTYDFTHLFDGIRDTVQSADVAMINQETILCSKKLGYSGYPTFGSPYAIGNAVREAGFDVVLHATNHTLDKGVKGVEQTIKYWKRYDDIVVAGLSEAEEESRISYIERNGIKLAILNYTYGLNGLKLPKGKEYMIHMLTDKNQMKEDIKIAKENSDFVIVCPHWGTEYVYKPTRQQEELTQFFLEEGVDVLIGTHPHVLEPVEWVESEDGKNKMLVYYSLGNFVSNQDAMPRILGGMAKIHLIEEDGKIVIDEAAIEPLVTHMYYKNGQHFVTYFLDDYTKKMATEHYLNRKHKNAVTLSRLQSLTQEILKGWYKLAG